MWIQCFCSYWLPSFNFFCKANYTDVAKPNSYFNRNIEARVLDLYTLFVFFPFSLEMALYNLKFKKISSCLSKLMNILVLACIFFVVVVVSIKTKKPRLWCGIHQKRCIHRYTSRVITNTSFKKIFSEVFWEQCKI